MKIRAIFILLLFTSCGIFRPNSLDPTGGNRIDQGNGSASGIDLDNIPAATYWVWIYPEAIGPTTASSIVQKGLFPQGIWEIICCNSYAGRMLLYVGKSTTALTAADTILWSANEWYCVAGTYDVNGADTDQHLYYGRLDSPMVEVQHYESQSAGSGSLSDNSSVQFWIGGPSGGTNQSFPGKISRAAVWRGQLTLDELERQRLASVPVVQQDSVCFFVNYGWTDIGSGSQIDLGQYGNNGTIVGSPAIEEHVPIPAQ